MHDLFCPLSSGNEIFQLFLAMDFFLFTETGHIKKENIGNVMFVPQVLPEHGAGPQRCQGDGGHCHGHVCTLWSWMCLFPWSWSLSRLSNDGFYHSHDCRAYGHGPSVRDMEVLVLFMIVSLVMYCMSLFGSMSKSWLWSQHEKGSLRDLAVLILVMIMARVNVWVIFNGHRLVVKVTAWLSRQQSWS